MLCCIIIYAFIIRLSYLLVSSPREELNSIYFDIILQLKYATYANFDEALSFISRSRIVFSGRTFVRRPDIAEALQAQRGVFPTSYRLGEDLQRGNDSEHHLSMCVALLLYLLELVLALALMLLCVWCCGCCCCCCCCGIVCCWCCCCCCCY